MPNKRTVTEKRLAANRAAARKSTGPKSPEGKQRAAFNSFQHGAFVAQGHILQQALARSGGGAEALEGRRKALRGDWQPRGVQEELLVDDLAWLYWLRDEARQALMEGQARRHTLAALARDERRFEARHRAPGVDPAYQTSQGCVTLPSTPGKFAALCDILAQLSDSAREAWWGPGGDGKRENPQYLLRALYGQRPSTARGQKLCRLWDGCQKEKAKGTDTRVEEILALLEEERTAVEEEEQLFARRQAMEIEWGENAGSPDVDPLGEAWQVVSERLARLDGKINTKIRLLLRLQRRDAQAPAERQMSNLESQIGNRQPTADSKTSPPSLEKAINNGTKPKSPLESTDDLEPAPTSRESLLSGFGEAGGKDIEHLGEQEISRALGAEQPIAAQQVATDPNILTRISSISTVEEQS